MSQIFKKLEGISGGWFQEFQGNGFWGYGATALEVPHPHAVPRVGSLNKRRPDIRPLYLLFVELETDLVTIEIYVVSDLESPLNS